MKTIGAVCAWTLCAASVTAQNAELVTAQGPAFATAQNAVPATASSAASTPETPAATAGILETELLVVSRGWAFDQQEGAQQIQGTFQPRPASPSQQGFQWHEAMQQWAMFLTWQHSVRLFQEKTHSQLGGPFWSDYARSVKGLGGWWDGDGRMTNYVGHPMQGAVSGYIQIQNDPAAHVLKFGRSGAYWRSRSKAFVAAAIYSTQFELGPVSEASIGNVGLKRGTMGFVDLVMTPLGALGMIVAEDAIDRYVIAKAEAGIGRARTRVLRTFLNPNRSIANIVRFQAPWHRDSRGLVSTGSPRAQIPAAAGRDATGDRR